MASRSFHDSAAHDGRPHYGYTTQDTMSLAPSCYTDSSFLELELRELFSSEWLCVGRVDDVKSKGDYFTTKIVGEPLLVVRSDDNQIRVLSNVCRHRSMQVASDSGNRRIFVCPYHAWSYRNDGHLHIAPLMDATRLKDTSCNLPELPSEIWLGFIFVSLSAQAPEISVKNRLAGLQPYVGNYHAEQMRRIHSANEVWWCNWKSLVENFMEGYHLSTVHPVSLGNSTPTKLCEKLPGNEFFTAYRAHYPSTAKPRTRYHPETTSIERQCSTLFSAFPGLVVSQSSDILVWLALTPIDCDQVNVNWGIASIGESLSESEERIEIEKWTGINEEDRTKLEVLHSGLKSRHAAQGPLAPENFEGTLADFYRYLQSRLVCRP